MTPTPSLFSKFSLAKQSRECSLHRVPDPPPNTGSPAQPFWICTASRGNAFQCRFCRTPSLGWATRLPESCAGACRQLPAIVTLLSLRLGPTCNFDGPRESIAGVAWRVWLLPRSASGLSAAPLNVSSPGWGASRDRWQPPPPKPFSVKFPVEQVGSHGSLASGRSAAAKPKQKLSSAAVQVQFFWLAAVSHSRSRRG